MEIVIIILTVNNIGILMDQTTTQRNNPVRANLNNTILFGKVITSMAVGFDHNIFLTSDGTVVTIGTNSGGKCFLLLLTYRSIGRWNLDE
jgi:alpha-tubulin suppressor-like RCC1 family protein